MEEEEEPSVDNLYQRDVDQDDPDLDIPSLLSCSQDENLKFDIDNPITCIPDNAMDEEKKEDKILQVPCKRMSEFEASEEWNAEVNKYFRMADVKVVFNYSE